MGFWGSEGLQFLIQPKVLVAGSIWEFLELLRGMDETLVLLCGVPLLRQKLLLLAFAEVDRHLLPLLHGVVHLGGHEDFRLGFFDDLYPQVASGLLLLLELTGWHLFFHLLSRVERHRSIALNSFPPVELVHLVVGSSDDFRFLGTAPLVASGGLLLDGGLHERGPVSGSQVGQLEC